MRKVLLGLLALILIPILYLLLWPVPINPGTWTPPKMPEMTGDYEPNSKLAATEFLFPEQCLYCEDVAIDSMKNIYGGSEEGDIIRFDSTGKREVIVNTGGRPLGLDIGRDQNLLYVADAEKGLLVVDLSTKKIMELVNANGGRLFKLTDDLEVAEDGKVYFSDASDRFGFDSHTADLIEHQPNGRFLVYDPATNKTKLLLDKLYFANGIAISPEQDFVLINETNRYQTKKYWLKGSKKGTAEIFMENLPGFPDGISQGDDGIFWLALISPRDQGLDDLLPQPFLRKMLLRLPPAMRPAPKRYGFVLGLNRNGKVIYNLQDPAGKFSQITSVQQFGNDLYFGSLGENGIGKYSLN